MTEPPPEPSQSPSPGQSAGRSAPRQPGERRLAHPPSDRYRTPDQPAPDVDRNASAARGLTYGVAGAAAGAVAMTVLGGVLAVSAGLLVLAAVTGWAVAIGLRAGGGLTIKASSRVRLALGLATLAVTGAQLGLWLYARSEGGVLGPIDYLAETFGFLVPLQYLAAWVVAWATAR